MLFEENEYLRANFKIDEQILNLLEESD